MSRLVAAVAAFLMLVGAAPPRDWTRTVARTADGAVLIGNPRAPARLTEFLSYTCSHCATFEAESDAPLARMVATGRVAYEVRVAVRDPLDFAMALGARCGAPATFLGRHRALFAAQERAIEQYRAAPPADGPDDARLLQTATAGGVAAVLAPTLVSEPQLRRCLQDKRAQADLTAQTKDAWEVRRIAGTPTFLLNGQPLPVNEWTTIAPLLARAAGIKG